MRADCKNWRLKSAIALILAVAVMISVFASPLALHSEGAAEGGRTATPSDIYIPHGAEEYAIPENVDISGTYGGATPSDMVPSHDALLQGATFDLSTGTGTGTGWTYSDSVLTVLPGANVEITGSSARNRRIVVYGWPEPTAITLRNVTIDQPSQGLPPITVNSGGTLNLTVEGVNTLRAHGTGNAVGIWVQCHPVPATLNIGGNGSLTAAGGINSAGIGGSNNRPGGTINIGGSVTITATGGTGGAGIGGGRTSGSLDNLGSTITIGGNAKVTATGGVQGAGIGGGGVTTTGQAGNGGNIIIESNATVIATGGEQGAGIGGGGATAGVGIAGAGGNIIIRDNANVTATGGTNGAGIGGGGTTTSLHIGAGGKITITGSVTVRANRGGDRGRSIGAGGNNTAGVHGAAAEIYIGEDTAVYVNAPGCIPFVWFEDENKPEDMVFVGGIDRDLEVVIESLIANEINFAWRQAMNPDGTPSVPVGDNSPTLILGGLLNGTHYFFVDVTVLGKAEGTLRSRVVTVEIIDRGEPSVTGVSIIESPAEVRPGREYQFAASVTGLNLVAEHRGVNWSVEGAKSAGTSINRVTGLLTVADDEGAPALKITAASVFDADIYDYIEIDVLFVVLGITIYPREAAVKLGETLRFEAAVEATRRIPGYDRVIWALEGDAGPRTTVRGGLLSVPFGQQVSEITVRAASAHNADIYATATVTVEYRTLPFVLGDANGDGRVTSADATMIARYIARHEVAIQSINNHREQADINGDGEVSMEDLLILVRWLMGHERHPHLPGN